MKTLLVTVCLALSVVGMSKAYAEWQLVYKNSQMGEPIRGSKARLVEAVRLGLPIRIAWGRWTQELAIAMSSTSPRLNF